jgi:hypothetical protein
MLIMNQLCLSLVTMFTVGYGDAYPVTPAGKALASIASIVGLLVVSLPVAIIGSRFQDTYSEMIEENKRKGSFENKQMKYKINHVKSMRKAKGFAKDDRFTEDDLMHISAMTKI